MLRCVVGLSLVVLGSFLVAAFSNAADTAVARRPAWTTSKIHGTPEPPEPYRVVSAFPQVKFKLPTSIEEIPGANRLLVTEMGGKIFTLPKDPAATEADLVVDLSAELKGEDAGKRVSLFDAELHPQFAQNRLVFICYVHPAGGGQTRLSSIKLTSEEKPHVVPGSEAVILTWPSGGHNAGCLEFGKDGYLYIATGDGSGPNPPDGRTTGQDVSDLLGAILRINVDEQMEGQRYSIPTDNPFVKVAGARAEIWSYGLRNPWKFGIDRQTGDVFVADNGWESWEMIHKLSRGSNCGWPVMEGRVSLRSEVKPGPTPIVPPIKDHSHTEANSVIGGPVYRGSKLPELNGSFVYGDYITGTIWAVKPDEDNSYSCTTLCDTDLRIVGFLEGSRGELYVLDYDFTGQIYELQPSGLKDLSANFPRKLSQTGLFKSLKSLEPAEGIVPYEVQVERWMDGAKAQRWVAIPGTAAIELAASPTDASVFPEGTVFIKHLELPQDEKGNGTVRVETQLLHFENGVWHPYSYLWNEAGDDAALVDSIGAARPHVPKSDGGLNDRTWHVNAVNECKLCHNAGPKFVLGFAANQLNHVLGSDKSTNQLARLTAQGVIAKQPEIAAADPFQLVDPHDEKQSLEDRARSYLHANCSMCHHPGGNAIVSFFLRRDLPFDKLNTNKGTGIGTFGLADAKIIVPGEPARSVLMYRMSKLGYARMPYIGSRMVDSFGVALVYDWIASLSGGPRAKAPEFSPVTAKHAIDATGTALTLANEMHRQHVKPEVSEVALATGGQARSDIRGLFDTFLPESKRRATLGPTFDPQIVLTKQGDLERGKLIFFSDGARCRNCHEFDDKQKSLGPTLREVVKKYPQTTDMLRHVMQPSLKIEEPFAAYTVVTDDGRVLTGLILEQNDKEVTLKTPEKQVVKLSRSSIDELRKSDKSLMPDRILSDLTAQEAADLLAYIRSQAGES